ncbi:uncharacterized protein BP5553_09318 [Venustampulla echinocandica]|uniref:Uncharacterized protein n=1 Tax=Venustampulla echinocandica TaxID=2656787 RepID=A0A370TCF7_9HELO|nr:uncharacterized protein BP5553_09318 [Venustampulla echinocandica]RDL31916.1 hypothetical protein BP5553_09318 [Venustampulla echinocandica]
MKSIIAVSALVAMVAAQLEPPAGPFTAGAWNPSNRWTGVAINASGRGFWIGKDSSSYCPVVKGLDCTAFPGTSTVFAGGSGTLSLDVAVPGGQQVFVGPDGALGYTGAHSASIPVGAVTTGFLRFQSVAGGAPVPMTFEGSGFRACPVDETQENVYQVFASAVGTDPGNCIQFQLRTYSAPGISAWQY